MEVRNLNNFVAQLNPFSERNLVLINIKLFYKKIIIFISNTTEVCKSFNNTFAKDIGNGLFLMKNTPSITKNPRACNSYHNFWVKTLKMTLNILVKRINVKKATGVNKISAKTPHAGAPVSNKHITTLVNYTINNGTFPCRLKRSRSCFTLQNMIRLKKQTADQSAYYIQYLKFFTWLYPNNSLIIYFTTIHVHSGKVMDVIQHCSLKTGNRH